MQAYRNPPLGASPNGTPAGYLPPEGWAYLPHVGARALLLYQQLRGLYCWHNGKTGATCCRWEASLEAMAERVGLPVRSLKWYLARLIRSGLLAVEPRGGRRRDGSLYRMVNSYRLEMFAGKQARTCPIPVEVPTVDNLPAEGQELAPFPDVRGNGQELACISESGGSDSETLS